jgi:hypothetical protein
MIRRGCRCCDSLNRAFVCPGCVNKTIVDDKSKALADLRERKQLLLDRLDQLLKAKVRACNACAPATRAAGSGGDRSVPITSPTRCEPRRAPAPLRPRCRASRLPQEEATQQQVQREDAARRTDATKARVDELKDKLQEGGRGGPAACCPPGLLHRPASASLCSPAPQRTPPADPATHPPTHAPQRARRR